MRIVAGVIVLIAIVLAQNNAAEACSCSLPPEPCTRMFFGPVFVGKAIKVVRGKGAHKATQKTTFKVSEVFNGSVGKTAVVTTGIDEGMCGKSFDIGTEYIVYADGTAADLRTGSCTGTQPIEYAKEDLAFGRAIPQRTKAIVDGKVLAWSETGGYDRTPIPGAEVRVKGSAIRTTTDAKGAFHFDLAPGKYELEVTAADVITPRNETTAIELPATAACAVPTIDVQWNGRISGRITDAGGKPVANVTVGAVDAVGTLMGNWAASTDQDGRYLIGPVSTGSYRVGVSLLDYGGPQPLSSFPTTYFPGTPDPKVAKIVTVKRAKLTPRIDFAIPGPLPAFRVSGLLRSATGIPAPNHYVGIDLPGSYGTTTTTDDQGRYFYDIVSGRDIVVRVCSEEQKCMEVKRKITGATVIDLQVPR